eukprot:4595733-Prymnesium_polylepis.1
MAPRSWSCRRCKPQRIACPMDGTLRGTGRGRAHGVRRSSTQPPASSSPPRRASPPCVQGWPPGVKDR